MRTESEKVAGKGEKQGELQGSFYVAAIKFCKTNVIVYRGATGMLITLVLLILNALDFLFFFLPSPIDPKHMR